jgi:tetratricopeptide (TPR) repeat protein
MSTLNPTCYQHRTFEPPCPFESEGPNPKKVAQNQFEKAFDQIIKKIEYKIFAKNRGAEKLTCPMTHQVFHNPFVDEYGRTFEKSGIEHSRLEKKESPTNNGFLAPNLLVKALIEKWQQPGSILPKKDIEELTCPITHEVFRDPVIDKCGHTFEKSAIEKHLESGNKCPISRKVICFLPSNLLVKALIEKWPQIPTFSLFEGENPELASTLLQEAQTNTEKKEYDLALDAYIKAFQYTRNDEDYAPLPLLFEAKGDYDKATLAYLYLAKYQLLASKILEAIETMKKCQETKSPFIESTLVLIKLYYCSAQPEKGLELSIQTAEAFSKQNPEQKAPGTEQRVCLYEKLEDLYTYWKEYEFWNLWPNLGKAYQKPGQLDLAEKTYKNAFTRFHRSEDSLVLAAVLKASKKVQESVQAYFEAAAMALLEQNIDTLSLCTEELKQADSYLQEGLSLLQKINLHEQQSILDLQSQNAASDHSRKLDLSESHLKNGYERSPQFEKALALAQNHETSGEIEKSVYAYYKAALTPILERNSAGVDLCIEKIRLIDPYLRHLEINRRIHLLSQGVILRLQSRMRPESLILYETESDAPSRILIENAPSEHIRSLKKRKLPDLV